MKKLCCILVEDSKIQGLLLEKNIKTNPHLHLVTTFNNGEEALKYLKTNQIDLLFLDIGLPDINGFELIERLDTSIWTIITSSLPNHATKAFDFDVVDYLLKPYTEERFNKAVGKALEKIKLYSASEENDNYILVRSNLKEVRLYPRNILWVEALGDYVKIVTQEKKLIVLSSMKDFLEKLPSDKFLRIHKSYIVNIEKIEVYNHKHVQVQERKLPLSRNNNVQLDKKLNFLN